MLGPRAIRESCVWTLIISLPFRPHWLHILTECAHLHQTLMSRISSLTKCLMFLNIWVDLGLFPCFRGWIRRWETTSRMTWMIWPHPTEGCLAPIETWPVLDQSMHSKWHRKATLKSFGKDFGRRSHMQWMHRMQNLPIFEYVLMTIDMYWYVLICIDMFNVSNPHHAFRSAQTANVCPKIPRAGVCIKLHQTASSSVAQSQSQSQSLGERRIQLSTFTNRRTFHTFDTFDTFDTSDTWVLQLFAISSPVDSSIPLPPLVPPLVPPHFLVPVILWDVQEDQRVALWELHGLARDWCHWSSAAHRCVLFVTCCLSCALWNRCALVDSCRLMSTHVDSKARDVNMKVEDVISIKEIFDSFDEDKTGTLELEETQMQKVRTCFFHMWSKLWCIMMHCIALCMFMSSHVQSCPVMSSHVQCQDVSISLSAAFLATLKSFPFTGAAPLQSLRSSKTLPWGYSHRNSGRLLRQSSVKLRENMWDMNEISVKTIENLEVKLGWLKKYFDLKKNEQSIAKRSDRLPLCAFLSEAKQRVLQLCERRSFQIF